MMGISLREVYEGLLEDIEDNSEKWYTDCDQNLWRDASDYVTAKLVIRIGYLYSHLWKPFDILRMRQDMCRRNAFEKILKSLNKDKE
jgi:hypothetical protein